VSTGKLSSAAVLRLPPGPLAARPDRPLDEWALLCRVDGQRDLAALAEQSDRGTAEAVAVAERLLAAGLLELASDVQPGPATDLPAAQEPEPAAAEAAEPDEAGPLAAEPGEAAAEATELDEAVLDEGGAAEVERTQVDPVSLLRELAADGPGGPVDQAEDWDELAQLAGDPEAADAADQALAAGAPPDGDAPKPARGGDQAAFMREFASLATGDEDPAEALPPPSDPDEDQPDDRARGGRFGFRKGQRR
jgi:hypothetical protein